LKKAARSCHCLSQTERKMDPNICMCVYTLCKTVA
jgi:hypothetical protein